MDHFLRHEALEVWFSLKWKYRLKYFLDLLNGTVGKDLNSIMHIDRILTLLNFNHIIDAICIRRNICLRWNGEEIYASISE